MDMYREIILDHYRNPRNFGNLDNPDVAAQRHNAVCGDTVRMEIRYSGSGEERVIREIRFSGEGCAINQASASMLTEKVIGMRVADVLAMTTKDVLDMLGTTLTATRVKCAVLPLETLSAAMNEQT